MWNELPDSQKEFYKRMILAFASLSEMFAQKADYESDNDSGDEDSGKAVAVAPIINSKYQETVFQRSFHAKAEDIGNTAYDASISFKTDKISKKILVGIKTFGIGSGDQKIAQFKGSSPEWTYLTEEMAKNAAGLDDRDSINIKNEGLYLEMAQILSKMRNERIESAEDAIKGFGEEDAEIECVYHVLMPSKTGESPQIYVGETSYTKIDTSSLKVTGKDANGADLGCTSVRKPQNFKFSDGVHVYKFTPSDSQLYMTFNNKDIVVDTWNVIFDKNATEVFLSQADKLFGKMTAGSASLSEIDSVKNSSVSYSPAVTESYSWLIENSKGEVEKSSGFNNFYGVSSKNPQARLSKYMELNEKYGDKDEYIHILNLLEIFVNGDSKSNDLFKVRDVILWELEAVESSDFKDKVTGMLFRLLDEMYIPLPNSAEFHRAHPDFFGPGIGRIVTEESNGKKSVRSSYASKAERDARKLSKSFDLVFEPSGKSMKCFITQDNGKGLQSLEHQAILGNWILKRIFKLREYEPLTVKKMNEIGLNGIRIYRTDSDDHPHLRFIWIDKDNLPKDFIKKSR